MATKEVVPQRTVLNFFNVNEAELEALILDHAFPARRYDQKGNPHWLPSDLKRFWIDFTLERLGFSEKSNPNIVWASIDKSFGIKLEEAHRSRKQRKH